MRALFFCNEMLGLGHLGLALALGGAVVSEDDGASALVVTGSPAGLGAQVPDRVDVLKLPTLPVDPGSAWRATTRRPPAGLGLAPETLSALRSEIALAATRALAPQVAVIDYKPTGRCDELRPTLEWLRTQGGCVTALGLWEADDAPERLDGEWSASRLADIRDLYDLALVYGPEVPGDLRVQRLRSAGVSVHHPGMVAAPPATAGPDDLVPGYLLVTAGGGVDGFGLLDAVLTALRGAPIERETVLIAGPMMDAAELAQLHAAAAGLNARVLRQRSDMGSVLAGARAVVAMAGYCTVAEILASGTPALLVPRTFPREEQLNRARLWAAAGRVAMRELDQLDPASLHVAIRELLAQAQIPPAELPGARRAVELLRERALTVSRPGAAG